VSKDFPDVKWDKMLVDAMTIRMIRKPESLDVIACTNLHGDILSDLAAGLSGSIGIAPSCNLDPSRKSPSMFEPVHGAAFDITGKSTFWDFMCGCSLLTFRSRQSSRGNLVGGPHAQVARRAYCSGSGGDRYAQGHTGWRKSR